MSIINLDNLLAPVTPDDPCGEDLSDLTEYYVLEEYARGKEETQYSAAEPPDWHQVEKLAQDLLIQGKEMWVVVHLMSALISNHGVKGLLESIKLLSKMISTFWENIYPEIDPDDENPFEQRMNILNSISTQNSALMNCIKQMPLCNSRQLGEFSLRDLMISRGEISPEKGKEAAPTALIEGAVKETDPEILTEIILNLTATQDEIHQIDAFLNEKAGENNNTSKILTIEQPLNTILNFIEPLSTPLPEAPKKDETEETQLGTETETENKTEEPPVTGTTINTRDDVYSLLGEIISWYEQYEPASPVAQILGRARILIGKSFRQIITSTLGPDVPQINLLFGAQDNAEDSISDPIMKTSCYSIKTRADIPAWLDRITIWYYRFEPSSPVPLFIDRAKQLVGKNFQEIINEIADQAQAQVADLIQNK